MPTHYIDATIPSVSGTGSGTLIDPWGKDEDLLQYAIDQSGAISTNGEEYVVTNGDLVNTAPLDLTGFSFTKPITVRPLEMDGSQRVGFDMGNSQLHPATNISGINLFYIDFTNLPATGTILDFNGRSNLVFCSLDGSSRPTAGAWITTGAGSVIYGCHLKNDQRTDGLFINASGNGNLIQYNYFDGITLADYDVYTYASYFGNNVLRYDSSYNYAGGSVLPIDAGKIVNNTFLGPSVSGGSVGAAVILITNSYECNIIQNNYFEGFSKCMNLSAATTAPQLINMLSGNKYFNCTEFVETATLVPDDAITHEYDNVELSSSGLIDAANGDYRPTSALIRSGYNAFTSMSNLPFLAEAPTVGAIEGESPQTNIYIPRIRDIGN